MGYLDLNSIHNPASATSPPPGWGDQARDNDEYLYQRGPLICTSTTRPATPAEGYRIYETNTNREWIYTGAAWRLLPTTNTMRCVAQRTTTQSLTNSTVTAIVLNGTDLTDTDAMHDPAGGTPSRIVLPAIGLWRIHFALRYNASATGGRAGWVGVNTAGAGTGRRYALAEGAGIAGDGTTLNSSDEVEATAITDYIELFGWQASGGALLVSDGGINGVQLSATYAGPIY